MPLAVIILGRDVLLSLSAFYIRYTSLPAPVRLSSLIYPSARLDIPQENLGPLLGLLNTLGGGSSDQHQQGDVIHHIRLA